MSAINDAGFVAIIVLLLALAFNIGNEVDIGTQLASQIDLLSEANAENFKELFRLQRQAAMRLRG